MLKRYCKYLDQTVFVKMAQKKTHALASVQFYEACASNLTCKQKSIKCIHAGYSDGEDYLEKR